MEYTYIDIQAHIRQAQQLRSDAMGEILSLGWQNFKQALNRLTQREAQKGGKFAKL